MVLSSLVSNSLNDNTHMAFNRIIFCPITSLNIDVFFMINRNVPFVFLVCVCVCVCPGVPRACVLGLILAISHKVIIYVLQTYLHSGF